ncbi:unnamed protein product [Mesocestoides corti]|uniref:Actin n=1 Tax=Mesocestoides corti TaxID=53468 RepID=A0A0R3UKR3_MESCO|nr:unnamed protein product [Mesocestoides corti]
MQGLLTPDSPVVIDPGTYRWRVGLANSAKPKSSFMTEISMLDGTAVEDNGKVKCFESTEISLAYFERYIHHGLRMLNCDPHGVSLCVAVPLAFSLAYRRQVVEVILESVGAKSVFLASQPLLSGFSSGHPTGLIIDSGYTYTSIYGMYNLYPERTTELIYSVGGRDIDEYLKQSGGSNLADCSASDINYIKSHFCTVSPKPQQEQTKTQPHQMPDGRSLNLGNEVLLAPELLFNPGLNGSSKSPSINEAILQAVSGLPQEKVTTLLKTVIYSGGNLKFNGLGKRLQDTLSEKLGSIDIGVEGHCAAELGVWRGGAIFASMPTYPSMAISKERWKEHGELIVRRKWL